MKAETYALELHTSAGPCTLTMYDTTLHAKGGLPATDFFRTADAALVLFDLSSSSSSVPPSFLPPALSKRSKDGIRGRMV